MPELVPRLNWTAPSPVQQVVASLGRTEDICFSASGGRLAIAGFIRNRVTVFDVELSSCGHDLRVALTGGVEFSSPALSQPHGVDFLSEETIIVTNRSGDVCLFALPSGTYECFHHVLRPIATWPCGGSNPLTAPGSVCARALENGGHEVLVCDNSNHTVTRHRLDARHAVSSSHILLRKWLDVPDAINCSADYRWVAVSNHNSRQVFLYDRLSGLDENTNPVGILRGMHYPHGLRFSPDARHLFLADAAAPYLHIYASDRDEWRGVRYPTASLRIMDSETFMAGRHNSQEGGPKGVAVDRSARVLVVTSERQPLACFDVAELLRMSTSDRLARERHKIAVAIELDVLAEKIPDQQRARENSAALDYMRNSASWRLTALLRRVDSVFRRRD